MFIQSDKFHYDWEIISRGVLSLLWNFIFYYACSCSNVMPNSQKKIVKKVQVRKKKKNSLFCIGLSSFGDVTFFPFLDHDVTVEEKPIQDGEVLVIPQGIFI